MLATNTLAGIVAGAFPIPGLSQAVRNALRLFVPSPQYCFSNTAGTTPAVQDGNVALWLDSAYKRTQMVNGSLTSSAGWAVDQPTSGAVTFSASGVRINSANGSYAAIQAGWGLNTATKPLVVGNMYRISFDAAMTSGTISVTDSAATTYMNVVASGRYDAVVIATSANFMIKRATATDGTISNLNITDLGIGASQATTGFQPKLRKGAKNWLLNSTMQGAVSGSPGTEPNNWLYSATAGITRQIVGIGSEIIAGVPTQYIDVRFFGTATAAGSCIFDPSTNGSIQAVSGQLWTFATYLRLIAGALPTSSVIGINERTSGGGVLDGTGLDVTALVNSTYQRFSVSRTLNQATTAMVTAQIRVNSVVVGQTIDFTLRIAAPQLELGVSTPSTYAPTSGSPSSNGVGNWWLDFDGVQTRMDFSSILYTNVANNFGVSGVVPQRVSGLNTIYTTTGSSNQRLGSHYISNGNAFQFSRDDGGTGAGSTHTGIPGAASVPALSSHRRIGSNIRYRANSNILLNQDTLVGATTVTASTIGHQLGGSLFAGGNYGIGLGDVPVSDSEIVSIERYIGNLVGVTV